MKLIYLLILAAMLCGCGDEYTKAELIAQRDRYEGYYKEYRNSTDEAQASNRYLRTVNDSLQKALDECQENKPIRVELNWSNK